MIKRTSYALLTLAATAASPAMAQSNQPGNPAIINNPNLQVMQLVQPDPDPAMNHPDRVAWELFVEANKPSSQAGKVLFETWYSDDDTFSASATCPPGPFNPNLNLVAEAVAQFKLNTPALLQLAPKKKGLVPHIVPGGGEEVRRNPVAHRFIVCNKLNTKAGLKAAFTAGKTISFPIASIEVKGEWIPVNGTINASNAHVGTVNGQQFALVGLHVISKQVPNWTWATFEHQNNPGRCDYQGCFDKFGATNHSVLPKSPADGQYPACTKTAALKKMFTDANLEAVYENYCLKGSQTDFTTSSGLPVLVGNSTIEDGGINPSSCMTCHARAAFDKNGNALSMGMNQGAVDPNWFYSNPGKPTQKMNFMQADFVWAIPFKAK